jgi:hypothetical protein
MNLGLAKGTVPKVKVGVKAKRLQAGWDDRYLLNVLSQAKGSTSKM